jgi:NhaP-type Na+/H+ or K+/H+ antiporter
MTSDVFSAVFWGVLFYATFPWMMIAMQGAAHSHHAGGPGGYRRDYFLRVLPIMPGTVVLYLALMRTFSGKADLVLWTSAVVIFSAGLALFWLPPIRAAGVRMKAAHLAAAAALSPK